MRYKPAYRAFRIGDIVNSKGTSAIGVTPAVVIGYTKSKYTPNSTLYISKPLPQALMYNGGIKAYSLFEFEIELYD